ncbi:hypothetical protein N9933_02045 [bacterium]|nr:hypothetical protein [bacterium]
MKTQLLTTVFAALLMFTACQQPTDTPVPFTKDYTEQIADQPIAEGVEAGSTTYRLSGSSPIQAPTPGTCTEVHQRNTVNVYVNARGVVKKFKNYLIVLPSGKRLTSCHLPRKFKKEGTFVTFDCEEKEVYDGEVWEGSPVDLHMIKFTYPSEKSIDRNSDK